MRAVKLGDEVLAEQTESRGLLRCTAVLSNGEKRHRCAVLIQRSATGDLVDGVRAHYKICHPEKGIR